MRPRKLLRIARWEVTKNAGGLDRRTIAVVLAAVALLAVVAPLVAAGGVGVDDGLYRVGVDETSPYYDVVAEDDTFVVEPPDRQALQDGDIELLVVGETIEARNTPKGAAAHDELRSSVQQYNDRLLSLEANQTAAFPVSVVLEFRQQVGLGETLRIDADEPDEETESDADEAEPAVPDTDDPAADEPADDATTDDHAVDPDDEPGAPADDVDLGEVPEDGGLLGEGSLSGSPSNIDPPFPFESLVLAFIFVIPLNFVIQAYGSTILSERINRRGELLLVSPVSRLEIIGGKTLPYFVGAMLVEGAIAVGLVYVVRGDLGGLVSVLAMTPLVLLFLGATFLGAMFARSFKELTFVTVTITVVLTSYAFVPAIFTDVGAIALISPLTLVVRDLQNEAITLGEFAFSTLPPLLSAVVFFGLGSGLYREEDMFDQRSIRGRVLDALAGPISRPYHVGVVTVVLIPFVFVLQLLAVASLFALGEISVVLILVVVAITEELAKSLHIYAAYDDGRFDATTKLALGLGMISGVAFFLGEKLALLAQLVGLPDLAIGEAALQGAVFTGPIVLLFLLAPLALHVVTAAISAVGASRGKRSYILAVSFAMLVHFVYNLTVVMTVV